MFKNSYKKKCTKRYNTDLIRVNPNQICIVVIVFPLAFQCRIPNYSTAKTREDIAKRKRKTMVRFFFIFWIRSNIFLNFLGCRRPIFKCFYIIRFVCPLAFQCRTVKLPNFGLCCNFGQNIVNLYDFF